MTARRAAPALLLALQLGLSVAAAPARADDSSFLPPRWLLTFGLQGPLQPGGGLPIGLLARVDFLLERAASALLVHAAFRTVSLEIGAGPNVWAYGGFVSFNLQALVEPGFYLLLDAGATLDDARRLPDPASRRIGFRYGASAQLNVNYRKGRLWLYSRDTAWAKGRLAREYDTLADMAWDTELALELANAVFVNAWRGARRRLWLYAEYTHVMAVGNPVIAARPSVGLVIEQLWRGATLDVDLSYGLREGPTRGLGGILVLWLALP